MPAPAAAARCWARYGAPPPAGRARPATRPPARNRRWQPPAWRQRATRMNLSAVDTPMAIIALVRSGPRNAVRAIARIRNGQASIASTTRDSSASIQPPANPASSPARTPIPAAISHRDHARQHACPRPEQHARQHVAAILIDTHPMRGRRCLADSAPGRGDQDRRQGRCSGAKDRRRRRTGTITIQPGHPAASRRRKTRLTAGAPRSWAVPMGMGFPGVKAGVFHGRSDQDPAEHPRRTRWRFARGVTALRIQARLSRGLISTYRMSARRFSRMNRKAVTRTTPWTTG